MVISINAIIMQPVPIDCDIQIVIHLLIWFIFADFIEKEFQIKRFDLLYISFVFQKYISAQYSMNSLDIT